MRRELLNRRNSWQAYLYSREFSEECTRVCASLSWLVGEGRRVGWKVEGDATSAEVMKRLAFDRRILCLFSKHSLFAVLSASPLLCANVVRRITRSERLVLSPHFQKAAMDLLVFGAAAAAGTGLDLQTGPFEAAGGIGVSDKRFIRATAGLYGGDFEGCMDVFLCGTAPETANENPDAGSGTVEARIMMEVPPLDLDLLRGTAPGDVINVGTGPESWTLSTGGRYCEKIIEFQLEVSTAGGRTCFSITSGPEEVQMEEAQVVGGRSAAGCISLDRLRLPARLELFTVSLPVSELGRLAPGQIIDVGDAGSRRARMYVCGELFAEGRLEKFEDFHGFCVEKVF